MYRFQSHACSRLSVPGVSESIRVRSIVGRYLEHSRIFHFANGGQSELYFGSADWMPRNFDRRVEVVFPVEDEAVKRRVCDEILAAVLLDDANVRFATYGEDGPGAILDFQSHTLSGGNGNGKLDFNECNQFSVNVKNNGSATATGILATLSSSTPAPS